MRYKKKKATKKRKKNKRIKGTGFFGCHFYEVQLNFYQLGERVTIEKLKNETKKNYPMIKLPTLKRITLPNRRTFAARYKRIKRSELPPNKVIRRTYRRQGQGIFDFVRKVAKNPFVKTIAIKGLEYAPGIYHNLLKKVKNKTLKRILNSDAAHLALNKAIKTANNRLDG